MAQADVLPFDCAAAQESCLALSPTMLVAPFAFEALKVGIGHEVADIDDAGWHAFVLPEGITIPVRHVAIAEYGALGGGDGRETVEIVAGVPAAEMDDFEGIERDVFAIDLVEIAG